MRRIVLVGLALALACADEAGKETTAANADDAEGSVMDDNVESEMDRVDDAVDSMGEADDVPTSDEMTDADPEQGGGAGAMSDDADADDSTNLDDSSDPDDASNPDDGATDVASVDDDSAVDESAVDDASDVSTSMDDDSDDASSTDVGGSSDDSSSGNTSTTTYSNCLACAESKCPTEYAACTDNVPCSSLVTCLEACWNADDWDAYDQCNEDCALSVDAEDPQANAIGIAIGYCIEEQCDESECLTHTVVGADEDDDEPSNEPTVEIEYDDGYLTAGPWHGYVWTQADEYGSAITILDHEAGEPLCISTDVELVSPVIGEPGEPIIEPDTYVRFGFNLNQERGEPPPTLGTFSFDGYTGLALNEDVVDFTTANPPTRIELWPPGADVDPTLRACVRTVGTSRVSLGAVDPCDEASDWNFDRATPIESLVFYFDRYAGAPTQYCIFNLAPI